MTYIPPKRKRSRMGIRVNVEKVFMRHRRFVKGRGCCVPGCQCTDIEFTHERNAANSGTGTKPHDAFGRGLCGALHHREEHQIGADAFDRKYGINRYSQAAWFVHNSPDTAMRESFYALPAHVQRPLLEAA